MIVILSEKFCNDKSCSLILAGKHAAEPNRAYKVELVLTYLGSIPRYDHRTQH